MINVYGCSFRNLNFVKKSVESLIENKTEEFNFYIAENNCDWPGSETKEIRKYLRELVNLGEIKAVLEFEDNCFGFGLMETLKKFPPDNSESFFMLTDLDLIVPKGADWIGETRKMHKEGAVLTGFQLSTENYIAPCHGFSKEDENFGNWLMGVNKDLFFRIHGTNINCIDSRMMVMFRQHGKVQKIRSIELYHKAWDIFLSKDQGGDPEYAEFKGRLGSGWVANPRPVNMSYKLIEK